MSQLAVQLRESRKDSGWKKSSSLLMGGLWKAFLKKRLKHIIQLQAKY